MRPVIPAEMTVRCWAVSGMIDKWQGETEVLKEWPAPVPSCQPQIPYGLTWASVSWWLMTRAMAWPNVTLRNTEFLHFVHWPVFWTQQHNVQNTSPETDIKCTVMIKLSLYRSRRPLGLREVEAPTFSDIWLMDGGLVVSSTCQPLLTPRKIPGTHFC
jgi:hypothetical protein